MYTLYGEDFIRMIQSFYPEAKPVAGRRELVLRCRECGDSDNIKHAHLYVKVPQSDTELSFYHCKKCDSTGLVDDKFLRKYGCTDQMLLINVLQHINKIKSISTRTYLYSFDKYPLKNTYISARPYNKAKLDYINKRIGSSLTYESLLKLKIVLNLDDVIRSNNLQPTRHEFVIQLLSEHFVGFISYDNKYVIMRKYDDVELYKSVNNRYIVYKLIQNDDNAKSNYVIPSTVNTMDVQPVNIHITEGVFDILSVFYNLNKCNTIQNIYIAAGGKSYYKALESILQDTGVVNYNIHFYPDGDVTDAYFHRTVMKQLYGLPYNSIIIHRNTYPNEKDYGVPLSNINDMVVAYNGKTF